MKFSEYIMNMDVIDILNSIVLAVLLISSICVLAAHFFHSIKEKMHHSNQPLITSDFLPESYRN